MTDRHGFAKMETLLRDHPGAVFFFTPADECFVADQFGVGIPVDVRPLPLRAGYGDGKAWGYSPSLETAINIAIERATDLTRAEAA